MVPKYTLTFREVQQPITQLVTKFGGQPVWMAAPQWPLSRSTGEPMRFVCQVALDLHLFGVSAGHMAYLFISDGETFVDNTFDPNGGENALVIQPGDYDEPVQTALTGPTLYKMVPTPSGDALVPASCEFAVELSPGEDLEVIVEDEQTHASDEAWEAFTELWSECKVGGTPVFLQGPDYPDGAHWRLLLQFDSASVPFYVNFGSAGVGYAFLSEDGRKGKFLWQSF